MDRRLQRHRELVSLRLPPGLRYIGSMAFHGCAALAAVPLPAGVRSIGPFAFAGCEALSRVVLPPGVRTVGNGAFSGCVRLREIVLGPDTVVDPGAFKGCPGTPHIIKDGMEP